MTLKRRTTGEQPTGNNIALIDGDIINYQASAVSDKVSYYWKGHSTLKYKKDALKYGEEKGLNPDNIIKEINPEPVSHCLHTVKQMIIGIMTATNSGSCHIFLTGEGNYREQIDSRYPYKGNRPDTKPTHFKAVKDYLIKKWGAEVVDGMEADDALGIRQWANLETHNILGDKLEGLRHTIICTRDKDLNMIPGWHYDWVKDEKVWIDMDEADLFFYKQLLAGDKPVDNIVGIHGVGLKTAEKILEDCPDNLSRYERCLEKYEEAGMDYYDLLENANLLWMQREEGVLWTPPTKK